MTGKDRQFNFVGFINSTIVPILHKRGEVNECPVLGIDECLNNEEYIGTLSKRLVARRVVSLSTPLWYTIRETKTGERLSVLGNSISQSLLVPDKGKPLRGDSWPDEGIIANLTGYFTNHDRLCMLTQNTEGRDQYGLRRILKEEVEPVLEALSPKRLGLLVLAQSGDTNRKGALESYAQAVESRLTSKPVLPGFCWEEISV